LAWMCRYIDGKASCGRAPGNVPTKATPMFVGAASAALLNPFCGFVHDVRVYNRALPPVELRPLWGEMSHKLQVGAVTPAQGRT
jgi:hypothetical protein